MNTWSIEVIILSEVTVIFAKGNEDGTLKNIEWASNSVYIYTDNDGAGKSSMYFGYDLDTQTVYGMNQGNWSYDAVNNTWKHVTAGIKQVVMFGSYVQSGTANSVISNFNPKQPFRAVDYNEALREVGSSKSGYCKLSNGLIIQWGQTGSFSGTTTVTLPTPFSTTDYRPLACGVASGDYDANWDVRNYTTTTFQINQPSSGKKIIAWHAIGY